MDWYVAFTKSQCEAKVAEGLTRIGVATYIPMRSIHVKRHCGHLVIKRVLFPRYLFADAYSFDRRTVNDLHGFISNAGAPVKIASVVVDQIRQRVASGEFDVRRRGRLAAGTKVMITSGPFVEIEAQVETANERRANLLIKLFDRQISASIALEQLRAIL